MIVVDDVTNRLIDSKDALFIEKVFRTKAMQGVWETIDLLVQQWIDTQPEKYDSFVVSTKDKQDSRATKYGSNANKSLRELVDFPQPIHNRIRAIYKPDDLPFDQEFFRKFWKRYPTFRVASSL